MTDRPAEAWESSAGGPFCAIRTPRGTVEVWALGQQRFRVKAPDEELVVEGHDAAMGTATEFADELD